MRKKKHFLLLGVGFFMLSVFALSIVFINSNRFHAIRLSKAIDSQDIVKVESIMDENPSCINTVPTFMPAAFHAIMGIPRPTYSLHHACETDNLELIQILIDAGANLNGVESAIPLSYVYTAKKNNWYAVSQLLIAKGASLNYSTDYSSGKIAILEDIVGHRSGAALQGYIPEEEQEVLSAFYNALEIVDIDNVNWARVMQYCVSNDRYQLVKFLLDEGFCNVNDISSGMTALMFASRDSTVEMVRLLLEYDADKNVLSYSRKTAYDYAVEANKQDIAAILNE